MTRPSDPNVTSPLDVPGIPPPAERPRVTLAVAMRNEEAHIERCLRSLFAQDYPDDRLEILVMDGRSTDRSREIVERAIAGRHGCRLIDNPRITQAAGWNIGIDAASGHVIGIVGAHTELASDYVSRAVAALERTGADMVGGPVSAVSEGPVGRAVAAATSSRFGVGGAAFHYARTETDVDTVYMGVCRSELYRELRFDEEMVRNQDDELSYRLLDRGGRIVCDPTIRSAYRNRSTFASLWRQYFQYGYWKVRVFQKHPRQIRPRQLVPPAFVVSLLGSAFLAPISDRVRLVGAAVLVSYAVANSLASLRTADGDRGVLLRLPLAFAILHVAYGTGVLVGLWRFRDRAWETVRIPPGDRGEAARGG